MSSASRRALVAAAASILCLLIAAVVVVRTRGGNVPAASDARAEASSTSAAVLRVCADPNNLPFSNRQREGFENQLAELVARDLGRRVEYTWWPQRRGFIRLTLRAGACDVVMGVPAQFELTLTTRPYYRSTYVFVTRRDRHLDLRSVEDERLRRLSIGVHLIGDDYANVPPADALAARGIVRNVRGYSIYGNYARPNPPADLIDAVADGAVDVAVAWGPLAGFFAGRAPVPLQVTPIDPVDRFVFQFAISMGVRRDDTALRDQLNAVIARRRTEIDALLDRFGVPQLPLETMQRAGGMS
ncbi:MAG TPA: substrate-binding domain-containing protein [Vicinamibacterales bacterium]